jgi:hypothetical protein
MSLRGSRANTDALPLSTMHVRTSFGTFLVTPQRKEKS